MIPVKDRVFLLGDDDVHHPFEGTPQYSLKTPKTEYGHIVNIDPFPCYHHDPKLVTEMAEIVEGEFFPIPKYTGYFILSHESTSRTNGMATQRWYHQDDDRGWEGIVILKGKRIPIMHNMTRYLVTHEYGHIVHYYLAEQIYKDIEGDKEVQFEKDYAAMRGLPFEAGYGGRRWHKNTGEIVVNDFRIAICGTEPDFWPHDCKHPDDCPEVIKFWQEQRDKYSKSVYTNQ